MPRQLKILAAACSAHNPAATYHAHPIINRVQNLCSYFAQVPHFNTNSVCSPFPESTAETQATFLLNLYLYLNLCRESTP